VVNVFVEEATACMIPDTFTVLDVLAPTSTDGVDLQVLKDRA
jgi:hypothetical protein